MIDMEAEWFLRMKRLIDSGKVYRFEWCGDGDYEPFEGKPIKITNELCVKVTKGNSTEKEGKEIFLDGDELNMMKITEVKG